jgi:hypothetical protein
MHVHATSSYIVIGPPLLVAYVFNDLVMECLVPLELWRWRRRVLRGHDRRHDEVVERRGGN